MKKLFIRNWINEDVLKLTDFDKETTVKMNGVNRFYGRPLLEDIFFNKQWQNNYDWLIFVDEDCKVYDFELIDEIINYMEKEGYGIAGPKDHGTKMRGFRPDVPNMFFTIFKCSMLRGIDYNDYDNWIIPIIDSIPLNYNYYEPYYYPLTYCVYKQHMKFLPFKEITSSVDNATSILYFNDKPFCAHTWMTRFFNSDKMQHDRIIKMLSANIEDIAK